MKMKPISKQASTQMFTSAGKILAVTILTTFIGPFALCYGTATAADSKEKATQNIPAPTTPPTPPAPSTPMTMIVPINTAVTPPRLSYADAVGKAAPAVVSIQTTKEIPIELNPMMQDPFFRFFFGDQGLGKDFPKGEQIQHGLGSGVIVDERGYVLTNNHVIMGANSVIVKLADGRSAEAKLIGTDNRTDLAVLKITLDKLPVIKMGNSSTLKVGDILLAIGNPFGLERTVTQGIVSATGSIRARSADQSTFGGLLDNLIQTDAAINPGNSGGALVDSNGELVGINMAIVSRSGGSQGIGFAIPIDLSKSIMKELIETGHIVRGWVGMYLDNISEDMRKSLNYKDKTGVYVQATINNSPAQKAGILPGDIITKINNTAIKDRDQAIQIVSTLKPGQSYSVEVFRRGNYATFSVTAVQVPTGN